MAAAEQGRDAATDGSADRIAGVAERLFARNGLDEVPVRDITAHASVSISSVYYHFGSKEGLILAILERRVAELTSRRARLVESMGGGGELTLRDVITILVLPTAEMAADRDGGGADYVAFLGSMMAHRKHAHLVRRVFPFADEERRMLERVVPDMPAPTREFRFALTKLIVNQVLGERGMALRIWTGETEPDDGGNLAGRLIDFLTDAFTAARWEPHDSAGSRDGR